MTKRIIFLRKTYFFYRKSKTKVGILSILGRILSRIRLRIIMKRIRNTGAWCSKLGHNTLVGSLFYLVPRTFCLINDNIQFKPPDLCAVDVQTSWYWSGSRIIKRWMEGCVTLRFALASIEFYCHDMDNNWSVRGSWSVSATLNLPAIATVPSCWVNLPSSNEWRRRRRSEERDRIENQLLFYFFSIK